MVSGSMIVDVDKLFLRLGNVNIRVGKNSL